MIVILFSYDVNCQDLRKNTHFFRSIAKILLPRHVRWLCWLCVYVAYSGRAAPSSVKLGSQATRPTGGRDGGEWVRGMGEKTHNTSPRRPPCTCSLVGDNSILRFPLFLYFFAWNFLLFRRKDRRFGLYFNDERSKRQSVSSKILSSPVVMYTSLSRMYFCTYNIFLLRYCPVPSTLWRKYFVFFLPCSGWAILREVQKSLCTIKFK